MNRVLFTFCAALLVAGCSSLPSKDERSAAITQGGNASIEAWRERSSPFSQYWTTVHHIDGVFPTTGRGVFPLTPGAHELDLNAQFSRHYLTHWYVDAGETKATLTALPSHRYRVRAKAYDAKRGELWIEDVTTGTTVCGPLPLALETTEQPRPPPLILIPIPVK